MLVEAELEVHPHHGKVVAGPREHQLEGGGERLAEVRGAAADLLEHLPGALEEAEDGLGVAENVSRAHEARHAAADGGDGGLGGDGGGGAL